MGYDEKLIKSEKLIEGLKKEAQKLRWGMVTSMRIGVAGHTGRSNSSANTVAVLYLYKMKHDPKNPKWREGDRSLLSKGYVGIPQHAALAESGYFLVEDLKHTREIGSYLQGHPDVQKAPGIKAGIGSLGQGLLIDLGMALGQKLDHPDSRAHMLVGDGEIAEGRVWEAAMAVSTLKTDNLTAIMDRNRLQVNGETKERFDTGNIMAKFLSFDWYVIEINRYDMREILGALDEAETVKGVPTAVMASTVKGKGVSFAENVVGYHNEMLTEEIYRQAPRELTEQEQKA